MARKTTAPRTDWARELTDKIITAIEAGPGEWVKPWKALGMSGMPHNGSSGRAYNGLNVWLLAIAGYSDARWYTFKQAKALGANVRKGEKGSKVMFWKFLPKKDAAGNETGEKIPILRVFTVFNAAQIDGLQGDTVPLSEAIDPDKNQAKAINALLAAGADISHGGDKAAYSPSSDNIRMPEMARFNTMADYIGTLSHEIVHWTGAKSRLDRKLGQRFGSNEYAMEELVAEIGAAFLCARLGIEGSMQHPEYLAHWLKVLQGDKYAIFTAAREAQKAVDFILNGAASEEEEESSEDEDSEAASKAA